MFKCIEDGHHTRCVWASTDTKDVLITDAVLRFHLWTLCTHAGWQKSVQQCKRQCTLHRVLRGDMHERHTNYLRTPPSHRIVKAGRTETAPLFRAIAVPSIEASRVPRPQLGLVDSVGV